MKRTFYFSIFIYSVWTICVCGFDERISCRRAFVPPAEEEKASRNVVYDLVQRVVALDAAMQGVRADESLDLRIAPAEKP